jgi:hypothetical protein
MKECPNCKSIFANDLFFCLHDGAPLNELRERDIREPSSLETEVWPPKPEPPVSRPRAVWPYMIIGLLLLISAGLASAMLWMNRDRFYGPSNPNSNSNQIAAAPVSPTPQPTAAVSSPTVKPTPTVDRVEREIEAPVVDPTGRWTGEWSTKSGTLLDIEISLAETRNYGLDGQIRWTLRRTARNDKLDKIGLSATEFVRGSYDPVTGSVRMTGYKKDDPYNVLVMLDEYSLKVSPNGRKLTGVARNGGKWNGSLDLSR